MLRQWVQTCLADVIEMAALAVFVTFIALLNMALAAG